MDTQTVEVVNSFLYEQQPALANLLKLDLKGQPTIKLKLALQKRAVTAAIEAVAEARQAMIEDHREKDADGNPVKVLKRDKDGKLVFKTDSKGQPTDEPEVDASQIQLADPAAFNADLAKLMKETVGLTVPLLTMKEYDVLANEARGEDLEPILDFIDGALASPRDAKPAARGKRRTTTGTEIAAEK